ncbi:NmrA family NAD(P)-binding protein [Polaribacter tangerinus]|uniref:NmrA family NAD(P)-binding protein n=1 Tax=Polaribacter tangerinus TaxID=1920034 RepID=UPI000B4B3196|nr:NmrA family NAD(P)-binding protein [Polaribacter tangerinus]
MIRILITGATGNIGVELIDYLNNLSTNSISFVAVRNIEKAKISFKKYPNLGYRKFNFDNKNSYLQAFEQIDILFLLRPPHISSSKEVFYPLLKAAKKSGIQKVVFLSVQGAEKSKFIPHYKIEKIIQELQLEYIFVRPSYFMQNLTTTLLPEILNKQHIYLPSGNAKFNFIDVKNIAEVTAQLLLKFDDYKGKAYEITGAENKNFTEVVKIISKITGLKMRFKNVNPILFYIRKLKDGFERDYALVLTILHFIPRLLAAPIISDNYKKITGNNPISIKEFILREKKNLCLL